MTGQASQDNIPDNGRSECFLQCVFLCFIVVCVPMLPCFFVLVFLSTCVCLCVSLFCCFLVCVFPCLFDSLILCFLGELFL